MNPLGHPLQLLQGGPRRPGGAEPGGGGRGGLRWPTCPGTAPIWTRWVSREAMF